MVDYVCPSLFQSVCTSISSESSVLNTYTAYFEHNFLSYYPSQTVFISDTNCITDYEYEEPSIVEAEEVGHPDVFLSKLMAVNEAMDNVVTEELTGFEENLQVFGKELANVMMSFQAKYTKGKTPLQLQRRFQAADNKGAFLHLQWWRWRRWRLRRQLRRQQH